MVVDDDVVDIRLELRSVIDIFIFRLGFVCSVAIIVLEDDEEIVSEEEETMDCVGNTSEGVSISNHATPWVFLFTNP